MFEIIFGIIGTIILTAPVIYYFILRKSKLWAKFIQLFKKGLTKY